jgi:hypothetical protein
MRHRRLAAAAVLIASLLVPSTVAAASPIAGDDNATTNEDTSVTIDLFANDSDPDGDILDIASIAAPAHGSVTIISAFGQVQYRPRPDYNGSDQFTYTVVDGNGGSDTAVVSIFVVPVNDPPIVHDRSVTVVEGGSVTVNLQPIDPDKEACDLVFSVVTPPVFGSVGPFVDTGCSPNGDMASIEYTAPAEFPGDEFFTYGVSDGTVLVTASVYISITPVNDVPVAIAGSATTTSGSSVAITLNGYDVETCELAFAIASQPTHGSVSPLGAMACSPGNQNPAGLNFDSATLTYTPSPGFAGTDGFTFTTNDGTISSAPATISVTITAPPTLHVGDLDATTVKASGSWQVSVTVRIDSFSHAPIAGAFVRGVWANGLTSSCTTSVAGTCQVGSGSLARKIQSTTFRVTSVTSAALVYDSAANHDPDGSSDGTLISIDRP